MFSIEIRAPDGEILIPKLSGMGGTLWLATCGRIQVLLKTEKTTLHVKVVTAYDIEGYELLHGNKVITPITNQILNKTFKIKLGPVVKPRFIPPKIFVPERKIPCSIVIPSYNMRESLKKTVTALISQLSENDEIIVVDDGSNDGTEEMLKQEFPRIKCLRQKREGSRLQKARNMGIKNAKNDCVILLDADCIPLPEFVKAHKHSFSPNVVVTGKIFREYKDGQIKDEHPEWQQRFLKESELNQIRCGNLCFSRSFILKINGFTEDYDGKMGGLMDTLDFASKVMNLLGGKIQANPQARVIHKYHSSLRKIRDLENGRAILKQKIQHYTRRRIKLPVKVLIIVDVYGWAWDIASRDLLKATPSFTGKIVSIHDFNTINPLDYDMVLVYPWAANVLERLSPANTIICVAGGEQLDMMDRFKRCSRFRFYGACNQKIQAFLKKEFPGKMVFHLIHGVDAQLFKPSTKTHKTFNVGWVGNTVRGIKRFSLAEKIAEKADVKLVVADFKSRRSHIEMPSFYHSIDCLLVTSITEAHPLVVYEAMSCGLPVVTTNVGDVDKYIVHGKNGFILSVYAPASQFVETINMLKESPELRQQVGKHARATVIAKLSWKKISQQYTALTKFMGEPY